MNLILIGSSGAGKGTQIDHLITSFGLVHFSPGNLFRQQIKKRTALGFIAQKYIGRGDLVPDEVVDAMLEEWLGLTDPGLGIVFDGFPRTTEQAEFLDKLFKEVSRSLTTVIYLKASEAVILKRLTGQRACSLCNDHFNEESDPFTTCLYNKCLGEHLHALDDKSDIIRTRLQVFQGEIKPLLSYYGAQGKLVIVDAECSVEEVQKAITIALKASKP